MIEWDKFESLIQSWPFLAFWAFCIFVLVFGWPLRARIKDINELNFGGKRIILGNQKIEAKEIGEALTEAFRELEDRIEQLEAINAKIDTENSRETAESIPQNENLSPEMAEFLWSRVYPMLESDFWFARYIDTLAKKTSTSPELMLQFLKERPDVVVFKDGDRQAAHLKGRKNWRPSKATGHSG